MEERVGGIEQQDIDFSPQHPVGQILHPLKRGRHSERRGVPEVQKGSAFRQRRRRGDWRQWPSPSPGGPRSGAPRPEPGVSWIRSAFGPAFGCVGRLTPGLLFELVEGDSCRPATPPCPFPHSAPRPSITARRRPRATSELPRRGNGNPEVRVGRGHGEPRARRRQSRFFPPLLELMKGGELAGVLDVGQPGLQKIGPEGDQEIGLVDPVGRDGVRPRRPAGWPCAGLRRRKAHR